MGSGWLRPRPGSFTSGKETRYPLCRRLGGSQGRSGLVRKISPPTGTFPFVLSFLNLVYLYILCPHVTYSSTTHDTNIHAPGGNRIRDPSNRRTSHLRLKTLGHRDRRISTRAAWRVSESPTHSISTFYNHRACAKTFQLVQSLSATATALHARKRMFLPHHFKASSGTRPVSCGLRTYGSRNSSVDIVTTLPARGSEIRIKKGTNDYSMWL